MRKVVFTLLVVGFIFDSAKAPMLGTIRVSSANVMTTKATGLFHLATNKLRQVEMRRENLQMGNPELKETTKDEKLQSPSPKLQSPSPKRQSPSLKLQSPSPKLQSTSSKLQSPSPKPNETRFPESNKDQKPSQQKALRFRDNDVENDSTKRKKSKNSKKSAVKLIQRNSEMQIKQSAIKSMQRQGAMGNNQNETESDPENDALNPFTIKNDMIKMLASIESIKASTEVIARTEEYNDIVLCKITDRKVNELNDIQRRSVAKKKRFRKRLYEQYELDSDKKVIFIVHGLSAMGFVNVPCLNRVKQLKKLVQLYTAHLDKFDIFLVPLANPDGIGDRILGYWNKNKSPQEQCSGVALDRNFDVAWNYSRNSCSQHYPGPEPFSERESRAILDVLHDYSHKIVAYIHVHAGTYSADVFKGDAVLYPKGYSEVNTDDDKYIDIRSEVEEALKNAGFKTMSVTVSSLYNWYGNKVHGTSVDFASSEYGIPYAMEFVMQVYDNDPAARSSDERVSDNVLTEVWKRVIDTVFANIHKSTQSNDEK